MDPLLGEIRLFPFNYAPSGWALCNGQSLAVTGNQALYSLIGNLYGGNNQNFNLPNLNGRAIIHKSAQYPTQGVAGGAEAVTLVAANLPAHTHSILANNSYDLGNPNTNFLSNTNVKTAGATVTTNASIANLYAVNPQANTLTTLLSSSVTSTGGGGAHENRSPFLVLNYCIAISGLYPPRP
ncbi:phage tail protein [Sediminibacterium ginsengisoli]|uniref:Microcystin-dependent protein n=1 Tax=Sediminibacterium ginsengisoli TaxID=413434 RepID=A0A1T4L5M5_9BACT|nr:tail fiber protein [Sediminibacterium ginsengisoli]SJZ50039.1 Microcystin-dependent protein [Sediminibacterium ginsengisoli]